MESLWLSGRYQSAEYEGLRLDSSRGLRTFSLSQAREKMKNIFLYSFLIRCAQFKRPDNRKIQDGVREMVYFVKNVFPPCHNRGTKKIFCVPMRIPTVNLWIPRSNVLPLSHRDFMVYRATMHNGELKFLI